MQCVFNVVPSLLEGQKSDDPLSPAYVPSLVSFTAPHEKTEIEKSLQRYESAKLRNERRELLLEEEKLLLEERVQELTLQLEKAQV